MTDVLPCHRCGASLKATWNFCPECGTQPSDRPRLLPEIPWNDIGVGPVVDEYLADRSVERARRDRKLRLEPKKPAE